METEQCKRCGDEIEQDELGYFCRGCDHRTDSRGRKLTRQPTKGQKALRRFHDREAAKAADVIESVFGPGTTAEQQSLFRRPVAYRNNQPPKRWCAPCDALMVMRAGRIMCWRCGILWEPS